MNNSNSNNKLNKRPTIYIGAPISNTGYVMYVNKVVETLRDIGYNVYSAIEDESINDKTNDPSPKQIYVNDLHGILKSDIFVFLETGGIQVGTHVELGIVLGMKSMGAQIKLVGFSNNQRLENPQVKEGFPSASMNHLALGGVIAHGDMFNNEEGFVEKMIDMANQVYGFISRKQAEEMFDNYKKTGSVSVEPGEDEVEQVFAVQYVNEEGTLDYVREKDNTPRVFSNYDKAYRSSQQFNEGTVVNVALRNEGETF